MVPRGQPSPIAPPGQSASTHCLVHAKAVVSPGLSTDDAKLHRLARRNGGWFRSDCHPILPLGWSADDAELHHRSQRNKGQLHSGRRARWLSRPLAGHSVPPASSTPMNFTHRQSSISPKQQRDVALKAHVASVHFKCFRGMLQVFHTDVAKVDRDVAVVAMVCTRML